MSVRLLKSTEGAYYLVDGLRRTIREATQFLAAVRARGLSPATTRAYGFDLVSLYRWMGRRGLAVRRLTGEHLLEYVSAQREVAARPRSINRRLTTARLLFRFCVGRDPPASRSGPAAYYRGRGKDRSLGLHALPRRREVTLRVKVPRHVVEPLAADEVRHFLRGLARYRDIAIVHLMLLCGLRSAEVLQLRRVDVQFADQQLRVRGKGNRDRVLPLPLVVARSISDYVTWERPSDCTSPEVFVVLRGARRGRPMTLAGLRSLFRHRRRVRAVSRANPHRFRHTFGADMARAGVRLPILQRMMGHADGSTTLQYIHLSMADIADEYRRAVSKIQRRYQVR